MIFLAESWESELIEKEGSKEVSNDWKIEIKSPQKSFNIRECIERRQPKKVCQKPNEPRNKENEKRKANLPSDVAFQKGFNSRVNIHSHKGNE